MNIFLNDDLRDFIQKKIASGAFATEEAVLQEAVRRFRDEDQNGSRAGEERGTPQDFIDDEAIEYCTRLVEGKQVPSLEEVRCILSKIPGSMAQAVIEEREEQS
jgi:Arc/MetJ-type ribon-helix-helix transcriptional regulator